MNLQETSAAGHRRRRSVPVLSCAAVLAVLAALAAPPASAGPTRSATTGSPAAARSSEPPSGQRTFSVAGNGRANFDARTAGRAGEALRQRAAAIAVAPPRAVVALKRALGTQGLVSIDPLTGSPRQVARVDGFLTGPSSATPRRIALRYVRTHRAAFGLTSAALRSLQLRRTYVDVTGTTHLSFVQRVNGIPVFRNGLVAHVAADGRLVGLTGSPLPSVSVPAATPRLSAVAARSAAVRDVGGRVTATAGRRLPGAQATTRFAGGDRASLVWFRTAAGTVLAWQTLVRGPSDRLFSSVVDARTGRLLYRDSLTDDETALVWDNYPGAPQGGAQRRVTLPAAWLPTGAQSLTGPNAHVYTDVNDDDVASPGEEVRPQAAGSFEFPFTRVGSTIAGMPCTATFPCSWNPNTANSWRPNARQDATQVFFFVNRFHDHLAAAPISFTPAAGSFEGVDALQAQPLDGADTDNGLPDANHVDNANMSTPPDGQSPRMQMFLFHRPGAPFGSGAGQDPFIASNGGDEADVVYHEYTHGLSNRLVVDANGNSTLTGPQAGAMGEAWSDWYAMDLLASEGFVSDTAQPGQVRIGSYVTGGDTIRSQPLDCPVGSTSPSCPGLPGKPGGYTYGDFGRIAGQPEVHADGEIWGETLWDLRRAIGSAASESLITRAMELSPANPSFLDMRNAILQADAVRGRRFADTIWRVFAARGMGYFASARDGDDTTPFQDFSLPPSATTPKGTLTGTVTDDRTGAAVAGAVVSVGGHASSTGFSEFLADTTDAGGRYSIPGVFRGTYHDVSAAKGGYDTQVATVEMVPPTTRVDFDLRRDWAAGRGGAGVAAFTGPDFTSSGCGPAQAIDQSLGAGWVSTSVDTTGSTTLRPKSVVVKLPRAVDISAFAVDPGATCGLAGSASTKDYRIETSTASIVPPPADPSWRVAAQGTFTSADRHRLNQVPVAAGTGSGVRFVRFTMLSPQVPGDFATTCAQGGFSGCQFMSLTELEAYGVPTP